MVEDSVVLEFYFVLSKLSHALLTTSAENVLTLGIDARAFRSVFSEFFLFIT